MNRQSGFTLIELLLVLAIIGIISAIAIPALLGQREGARRRATEATAQAVVSETQGAAKLLDVVSQATIQDYVHGIGANGITNFTWPRCKNPYTPTVTSLTAVNTGAGAVDGAVGMVNGNSNDINGNPHAIITVNFKHQGVAASTNMSDVPAE